MDDDNNNDDDVGGVAAMVDLTFLSLVLRLYRMINRCSKLAEIHMMIWCLMYTIRVSPIKGLCGILITCMVELS